ncbi:hypothetical protein V8C34DRAFT_267793 [Trichoderma compactum]
MIFLGCADCCHTHRQMHAKTACGYCSEPKRRSAARTTFASTGIVKRWHYVAHLARIALPPTPSATARQNAARSPGDAWGIPGAPELCEGGGGGCFLWLLEGPTLDNLSHVTQRPSTQMHGVTHHPAAVVRDP